MNLMGKNGLLLSHERADSYCPHPLKGLDKIATVSGVDPFSTLVDAEKNMWKGFEVLFVEAVAEKIGFDIRFVRQVPVDMVVKANCRIFFFDNREFSYSRIHKLGGKWECDHCCSEDLPEQSAAES